MIRQMFLKKVLSEINQLSNQVPEKSRNRALEIVKDVDLDITSLFVCEYNGDIIMHWLSRAIYIDITKTYSALHMNKAIYKGSNIYSDSAVFMKIPEALEWLKYRMDRTRE